MDQVRKRLLLRTEPKLSVGAGIPQDIWGQDFFSATTSGSQNASPGKTQKLMAKGNDQEKRAGEKGKQGRPGKAGGVEEAGAELITWVR